MYANTSPWPLKLIVLCGVVFSEYMPTVAHKQGRNRVIPYITSAYFLSVLLPSVVFAMPSRRKTTAYIVQTFLMMLFFLCFLNLLFDHGLAQYEVVSTQLILTHMLWAQNVQLSGKTHILLYQSVIVVFNRVLLVANVCFSVFLVPQKGIDNFVILMLVFVPEMLGIAVLVASYVLVHLGHTFENFMHDY
jgi:hypothetical protein